MSHVTVLKTEAVHALNLKPDSVIVDCTLGAGGHADAIVAELDASGTLIGIDADPTAIAALGEQFANAKATTYLVTENFRHLKTILRDLGIVAVDGILADLGWRLEQFDGSSGLPRGFSFNSDETLEMTFGDPNEYAFTAGDIVNDWDEEDIANVIYGYSQDRYARRIAKAIITRRKLEPIVTARELAEVVHNAVPPIARRGKTNPATKTFQALRIAVNDEFDALTELLTDGFHALNSGGRMSIITFHSLEDKIVKETFKNFIRDQQGVLVTKKPVTPTQEELQANPRARSAKLRSIEKV